MKRFIILVLICSGLVANVNQLHAQTGNGVFDCVPKWREKGDCGQIAAYFVALMMDCDVTEAQVDQAIRQSGDRGVNLDQIANFLTSQGLDFRSGWVKPSDLSNVNFPTIIHLAPRDEMQTGHYSVLLDYMADVDQFVVFDTTFGKQGRAHGNMIRRFMSGYIVTQPAKSSSSFVSIFLIAAGCAFGVGLVISYWRNAIVTTAPSNSQEISQVLPT